MILATIRGDVASIRALSRWGADANAIDTYKKTALHYAISKAESFDVLRHILRALVAEGAARPTTAIVKLSRQIWAKYPGVGTFLEQAARRADKRATLGRTKDGKRQLQQYALFRHEKDSMDVNSNEFNSNSSVSRTPSRGRPRE